MLMSVPGTPIYGTLIQIQKQVWANGKSVPSSLGRGAQGNIGLVTSVTTYARINQNYALTRPTHPGPLSDMTN